MQPLLCAGGRQDDDAKERWDFLIKVQMFFTKYSCEMHVGVGRKYRIPERFPATTEVWAIFGKWRGEIRKRAEISFLLTPERKWEKGVCVDPLFFSTNACASYAWGGLVSDTTLLYSWKEKKRVENLGFPKQKTLCTRTFIICLHK